MKTSNIKTKYIKSGMVEFFVIFQGVECSLLIAKFDSFNDMSRLHRLAREELANLTEVLQNVRKAA